MRHKITINQLLNGNSLINIEFTKKLEQKYCEKCSTTAHVRGKVNFPKTKKNFFPKNQEKLFIKIGKKSIY